MTAPQRSEATYTFGYLLLAAFTGWSASNLVHFLLDGWQASVVVAAVFVGVLVYVVTDRTVWSLSWLAGRIGEAEASDLLPEGGGQ